jgi:hypothetical protein
MRKRFWQKKGPFNCGDGKLRKWTEAAMAELEREYKKVRTKVENGESLVHCKDGVAIVCTSNQRPIAISSGDFVASGL